MDIIVQDFESYSNYRRFFVNLGRMCGRDGGFQTRFLLRENKYSKSFRTSWNFNLLFV